MGLLAPGDNDGCINSSYDGAGRRTQMNHGGGLSIDYDHLVTGETTRVRENGATSGVGVLATYAYDDLGRRTALTRGNGTAKSYGYDAASRLASMGEDLAGTTADLTLGFTYNPASQIATSTRSNDSYAWTDHYNISRNYTANGLNQYSASGSVTPSYDLRGNLTSAGSTSYGYSSENMLTSATGGVALAYDPFLRLQQTSGGSAGTTKFAYDGQDLIAEYNGSNGLLRRYVHGPGSDEPLVWYEGTGTADRRWLHADERGSVIAVSNSSGATIATNAYDEYGIPKSTNLGRFQYTGQTWLPELGMYHYKARIYSPTLGRFLQTDPIGYGDGMNMYGYVGGDPVNSVDPSGLECARETTTTFYDYNNNGKYDRGDKLISRTSRLNGDCSTGGGSTGPELGPIVGASGFTIEELNCQRVRFANILLSGADKLNAGGDKALLVGAGAAVGALVATGTGVGAPGGGVLGAFATFSATVGLFSKSVASLADLGGHTVGSLATGDNVSLWNAFKNGVFASASSGLGGVAGGIADNAAQEAARQSVPNRYQCRK